MSSVEYLNPQFGNAEHDYPDDPLTANVRVMAEARQRYGQIPPEILAMILDEELTPVLEVIVDQTEEAYGVVPRSFKIKDGDLIDPFGQSVKAVAAKGSEWSRKQAAQHNPKPGAQKEHQRRISEERNVDKIVQMPAGSMLVESSFNPIDWTPEEQEAQNYTGLTMLRVSLKSHQSPDEVIQFNYVLPGLNTTEAILALQEKLGYAEDERTIDTNQALANPKMQEFDGSALDAAREVDGLAGIALLEQSLGHSAVRMMKRAIERRREAWRFITDESQADVHRELLEHIDLLSYTDPNYWAQGMAGVRTGFTRALKDNFLHKEYQEAFGSILAAAADRAVASGDRYVACGVATEATAMSRSDTVAALRGNIAGVGKCAAKNCAHEGLLFGCGVFCRKHNDKWCDEFERSGKQLGADELGDQKRNRSTDNKASQDKSAQTEGETEWQRIVRQGEEKKAIAKQQRLEAELAQRALKQAA